MRPRFASIRLRLTVVVLLFALASLLAVGLATYSRDAGNSRAAATSSLRETAQRAAATTENTLLTYTSLAGYLAGLQATRAALGLSVFALTSNPFDDQAQALSATYPAISGVYLTTANGRFVRGGALLEANTFGPATNLPPIPGSPSPLAALIARAAGEGTALTITHAPGTPFPLGDLWLAARVADNGTTRGIVLLRVDAAVLLPAAADPQHGISTQLVAGNLILDGQTRAAAAHGGIPLVTGQRRLALARGPIPPWPPCLAAAARSPTATARATRRWPCR